VDVGDPAVDKDQIKVRISADIREPSGSLESCPLVDPFDDADVDHRLFFHLANCANYSVETEPMIRFDGFLETWRLP